MNKDTNQIMALINAYKMDGLGNNFIILDRRENNLELDKNKIIGLASKKNINFDQLIFLEKEENNIYPITIFNPDGIEVDACGNGSRCVAYLISKEKKQSTISLRTNERLLYAEIVGEQSVKLNMGKPKFNWKEIPLSKNMNNEVVDIEVLDMDGNQYKNGFCLNVGNPHIIFFVKDCFKIDIKKLGPAIEKHKYFPKRSNVTFAQVLDKKNITINVWERGAGLTKACGTAACATAVAAIKKNLVDKDCNIRFKEGDLIINYNNNDNIFMTGPVSQIEKISIDI